MFFMPIFLSAQVNDDFEDGDIVDWTQSEADHWEVSDIDPLNGVYSMHHVYDNTSAGFDQISKIFSGIDLSLGTTTWQFQVKYGYPTPSSGNNWACFLFSDADANEMFPSGSANGYAVGVNYSGSDDSLRLWKISSGGASEVINCGLDWEDDLGTGVYGFQVTRTATGDWTVFVDFDGGFDNLVQIGETENNSDFSTPNYFGFYYEYSSAQDRKLWIDDVSIVGVAGNDDDSYVYAGDDIEPITISSLINSADGLQVFDVNLQDLGTVDILPTIVNSLTFSQGDNNDIVDWTNAIAGAKLFGTDLVSGIEGIVSADEITFTQTSLFSIANNSTETYQLYIWLKSDLSDVNDNDNLEFKLDFSDIICDNAGSGFGSGTTESGDDNIAIDIEATKINLIYPTMVAQNVDFSFTAKATDVNGNIDMDNTNLVTLSKNSGTGILSSSNGLSQNFISGQKMWTDLQYSELGDFSITATSAGLTSATTDVISCSEFVSFLIDDFEDGDIFGWSESESGHWAGSDIEPINGVYSLHLIYQTDVTAYYSDKISYAMNSVDLTADSTIWQFEVKFTNPSPSGDNCWYVFLTSDTDNSQMYPGGAVNGYVFGLNFMGTDDVLKLWNVTNGTATEIISTGFNWNNFDASIAKSVVVARSTSGLWEIRIDDDGGFDNLISFGTATDDIFTTADYYGIAYNYTKSNSLKFWIDDVYVGTPIPDTNKPFLTKILVNSPNSMQLTFNEDIDVVTAENEANYSVDNSIGNPSSAILNINNKRIIDLVFPSDFQSSTDYEMLIENIEDLSQNVIKDTLVAFDWQNILIESIDYISTTEIKINYTKEIDSTSAVQISNYLIDNSIGNPVTSVFDEINRQSVNLIFATPFVNEQSYTIHIENVEDVFGNIISPTDYNFIFYLVKRYDIIINELMVDINPTPIALPPNKYIEIYNVSNYSLNLLDWILKIGTNNDLVFPAINIEPHQYAIICSGEVENLFSPYGQTIPILTESYLTSTSGKMITLRNSKNEIIEQITYNPDVWYGDEDKDDGGWAMERIDPTNFCNQNTNWHASENYTGGTPGMINSVYGINPDTKSPWIEDITLATSCDMIIDFSETVDTLHATSLMSYLLNSSIIPISAVIDDDDNSIVKLHFAEHYLFSNNDLLVSNISDYCGNSMNDTTISFFYELINPTNVEPKSATQVKVYFSEPIEKSSGENYLNFSVNNEIGHPIIVTRDANDSSVVHLLFDTEFIEDIENILTVTGISDVNGNDMIEANIVFTYHQPEVFDVVINELMLDINPSPLGLPEAQYIELYNTTQFDIWLSDWIFVAESQSDRLFPTVKIKPNAYVLLCEENEEYLFEEFGITIPILGSSDLTQTGKELQIFDNGGKLIYHIRYSDTWYNDDNKDDGGWSLEKIDSENFCESSFNWGASSDISGGTPGRDNSIYAINTDNTLPIVVNISVKSSNKLVVQFSKSISFDSGLDISNYSVSGIGNPLGVSIVDTSYSTVILYFDTQFVDTQENILSITNVYDDCGNSIEDTDIAFTYYLIKPVYVWVLNQNQLQIKFSEELDYSSSMINDNYIVNELIGTPNYIVRATEDPSIIFLQFSTNFSDGVVYELSIANIEDVNGNVMQNATLEFVYYKAKVNDIVINEVLFNPYKDCVDFVELYNRSQYPINMIDLRIAKRDDDGEIANSYRISDANFLIQPETYLVVSTDTNNIQKTYTYGGRYIEINTMPSYSDDEGDVIILDDNDSIIDEFVYTDDMHFGLISNYDGISLERIDFNISASDTSNWHSAAETVGFATPGLVNSQYQDLSQINPLGSITLEPQVFSPDNDAYNDQLYIYYEFEQGGYVATVMIFNKNGIMVRELINDEYIGVDGFWIWDGLDDFQQKVNIGIYVVVVKIFDLDGNVQVFKNAAVVSALRK